MITYPILEKGATVGVIAPSSGVPHELHGLLYAAFERMEKNGFSIMSADSIWTQEKATSTSAEKRAAEFHQMMSNDEVQLIMPPWGGELLIEMLAYIDFNQVKRKWILGYSDISTLLLAITLKTGVATAHGTNLIDIRGEYSDETTDMWQAVLATKMGESIAQYSSEKYQEEWQHENPTPCVFNLTEKTYWKSIGNEAIKIQGRLLGGCVDTIRHLVGTPYGDVEGFREAYSKKDGVIWYLENCELSTADLRRSLVQMQYAGWFEHCTGILFGRSPANMPVADYTIEDVYQTLSAELEIPIIYDIDCGHVPPQMTFINGAYAEIEVDQGQGKIVQRFI